MNIHLQSMDIAVIDGALPMVIGIEEVQQSLTNSLSSFEGEWFLDLGLGMPHFQIILDKATSLSTIESYFLDAIVAVPGVLDIETFDMEFFADTRSLDITTRVRTSDGVLDFNLNKEQKMIIPHEKRKDNNQISFHLDIILIKAQNDKEIS